MLAVSMVLLAGCQSAQVGASQDPSPPGPTPAVVSEEPSQSPEPDVAATADPSEAVAGLAPGSDACRESYVQQLLAADPAYFDRRPTEDPIALLTYDRLTEVITADEHARWGMQRLFQPDLVPPEYRLPDLTGEGTDPLTGIALASMWETDCLPVETQQWLSDYLTPTEIPDQP
ncbi:hypothetical protein ASD18_04675 [Cellulomonas sp. Root137]|nr:hypothetical protein ASD18_04675 [Cellulomonas sp. Root137]